MKRRKQRLSVLLAALLTVSMIFNSPIVYAVEDDSADVPEAVAVSEPTDDAAAEGESGDALIEDEEHAAIEDEAAYADEDEATRGGLVAEEESDGLVALAENATEPTKYWVESTDANNIPLKIDLFKQKSNKSYYHSTSAYQLFLPGNANLDSCFLSWDGGATVTVNGTTYESGSLPIPALNTATNYTFNYGYYQSKTISVIAYQGSPSVPPIFIDIDESQGTIAAMNSDKSNTCSGNVYIDGQWYTLKQMKGRGNASWTSSKDDKRPYNITLTEKVTIPGTSSAAKKWTLLAESLDRSMLCNRAGFWLAHQLGIGQEAITADIWMNGEYRGCYTITPKIDSNVTDDGFMVEQDNYKEDPVAQGGDPQFGLEGLNYNASQWDASSYNLITVKKMGDDLVASCGSDDAAVTKIQGWLQEAWNAIRNSNSNYTDYIDIDSFAKMFLMQEYVKNFDVCAGSLYYYRDSMTDGDKLYAGPIWDLDNSLGSTCNNSNLGSQSDRRSAEGDFIKNINEYKTSIYKTLYTKHDDFKQAVKDQYNENKASFDAFESQVQQMISDISASASMNYKKVENVGDGQWKNLHQYDRNTSLGSGSYAQSYVTANESNSDWNNYATNLHTYISVRSLWFANNYYDPNYHVHEYVSEITKEATCVEEGVITYTCTGCGDTYTESIPLADHTFNDETGVCEVCGHAAPKATIDCGAGASVTVYKTKNFDDVWMDDATVAFPRDSKTGLIVDSDGEGQINFVVNVEDGYELVSVTAEPTTSYKNLKGPDGTDGTGIPNGYRVTKVTDDLTITVETRPLKPVIDGHNLLLSSEIGVQFKAIFPEGFDTTGSYMSFSVSDGRTGEMQLDAATPIEGENAYWFTGFVNALELADTITATLHYGTDGEVVDTYSAVTYINAAKEKYPEKTTLINLVNALQDYGYYLQESGWTDGKTHEHIDPMSTLGPDSIAAAKAGVSGDSVVKILDNSGIADAKFALTLNSNTVINVFLKPGSGVTITGSNANANGTRNIGGEKYFQYDTAKIGAGNLGKTYTITFDTSTGGTATVKASAMSYVDAVLNNQSFTEAKQLAMAAYYNYHVAVDEYKTN